MRHRHLNHQQSTLAAIDDVIFRGRWNDWIDLRCAILETPALLGKIEHVCCWHVSDPYAQRYYFWLHYARKEQGGWSAPLGQMPIPVKHALTGIDTGIRSMIRVEPLTRKLAGTLEAVQQTAARILTDNATHDYLELEVLAVCLGDDNLAAALNSFDARYPQNNGESPLQQLLVQLANALPCDLADNYLADWNAIKASCAWRAVKIFDLVSDAGGNGALHNMC